MSSFPQTATWKGEQCGRQECVTCNQPGEELPNCTKSSVVYESICIACNPNATKKGELMEVKEGAPSIYVGETSRSIQERALEHLGAARRKDTDSHINKHQVLEHNGEQGNFMFKIVSMHRTALNRQVKEAVRIRRRGGAEGGVLNSKSEFNRSHIPRLVLEVEEKDAQEQRLAQEQADKEELERVMTSLDLTWEEKKTRARELADKKRRRQSAVEEGAKPPKRRKKLEFALIEEQWGEEQEGAATADHGADELVTGEDIVSVEHDTGEHYCDGGSSKRLRFDPPPLTTSLITEYFLPKLKMNSKEEATKELSLVEEEDWFEEWTRSYRGTGGEDTDTTTTQEHCEEQSSYVVPGQEEQYYGSLLGRNMNLAMENSSSIEEHSVELGYVVPEQLGDATDPGAGVYKSSLLEGSTRVSGINTHEQSPPTLVGSEDDQKVSKDDLEDGLESGSDQDDLLEWYEVLMSQDDTSIRTHRETPPLLLAGGQEKVPDTGNPRDSSFMEGQVATEEGSPTAEQSGMAGPDLVRQNNTFVMTNRARDMVVVRVSDTSSDDGGEDEQHLSPIRAKVMGEEGEEDLMIPATPEPPVGKYSGHRAGRKLFTGKNIFNNTYNDNLELSDDLNSRGSVNDNIVDTPPPADVKTTPPASSLVESASSNDDLTEQPVNDKPGPDNVDGAVGGMDRDTQDKPVGVLTLDTTCEYKRGGQCLVHEGGISRKFKGGYKFTVGKNGVKTKRYQRSYYGLCDGKGGQAQSRLSFMKMTPAKLENNDATLNTTSKEG